MKTNLNKWINWTSIIIITLVIISLALGFFTSLSVLEAFRIIFGSIYVLFIPGFIISYIFFPRSKPFEEKHHDSEHEKGAIDWIERIALSFALSIAIVPLAVFYLNLIGVKINLLNSFLTIAGIIVISCLILYWRIKRLRN